MLLILLFCVSVTACNSTEQGSLFKYDIEADPLNLDPQSAEDYPSLLVIQNIFEGLLTVNPDGTLGEGVATDWSRINICLLLNSCYYGNFDRLFFA